jgi:hypothetical protein
MRDTAIGIAAGVLTCYLISALDAFLPYSKARDAIADALSLPGGLLAVLIYPEGVHTGHGAPYWGLVAMLGNWAFYAVFWYLGIKLLKHVRRRTVR